MRVARRIKRGFQIFIAALLVLLLILCGYVLIERYALKNEMPSVFGYSFALVGSGSMEPEIMTGDLIVVKSCDSYETGDVVTFWDEDFGGYITHRVVATRSDGSFVTKGDANDKDDTNLVFFESVVGKVVRVSSAGGAALKFFQDPVCLAYVFGSALILWIIVDLVFWIVRIVRDSKNPEDEETKEEGEGNPPEDGGPDAE